MAIQPLLPPPLLAHGAHPGDDSASNQGSSVAEDLFDDDCSSVRTSRDSVSIPGSLAGDSQDEANDHHTDDEDYSWIAADDMVILRAMSSSFSSSPNCDAAHAASARSRPRDGRATMYHQRRHQQLQRPQHQPHRPISRLPRGTKPVRLVGEGAANAVFEIQVPPHLSQRVSSKFQGMLSVNFFICFCVLFFYVEEEDRKALIDTHVYSVYGTLLLSLYTLFARRILPLHHGSAANKLFSLPISQAYF